MLPNYHCVLERPELVNRINEYMFAHPGHACAVYQDEDPDSPTFRDWLPTFVTFPESLRIRGGHTKMAATLAEAFKSKPKGKRLPRALQKIRNYTFLGWVVDATEEGLKLSEEPVLAHVTTLGLKAMLTLQNDFMELEAPTPEAKAFGDKLFYATMEVLLAWFHNVLHWDHDKVADLWKRATEGDFLPDEEEGEE